MAWLRFICVWFGLIGVSLGVGASCNAKRGETTCVTEDLLEMLIRINSRRGRDWDKQMKPAFFASLKGSVALSNSNKVLIFEGVKVNRGGGYDPSTGIFTAKRDGLYHFSCLIYGDNGKDVGYQLTKNESSYATGYSNKGPSEASTLSALMELKKGDRVYIKHRHSGQTEAVIGSDHSSFAGYFLQD
uniref:Putative C1q domain containing protein MgC1q49 n=1 Tax=Mytilus galloprovincialis TaxID=29158 RepID=F0V486_MYTGA|nr:putative C1q domain containing protein MgC1q49 [Mytilus galloprovincialis]